MKSRFSLEKAEWSNTREVQYKNDCDEILFKKHLELLIEDDRVYMKSGETKTLLVELNKPKITWYEIWMKLKEV